MKLLAAVLLQSSAFLLGSWISADSHAQEAPAAASIVLQTPAKAPLHVTKLVITDVEIGKGDEVQNNMTVEVHYTGWLYNPKAPNLRGAQFDSSRVSGTPLSFQVGARQVIRGWDQGLIGMRVGGKRILQIPSYLGYGVNGSDNIPPNTHLVFEVELVSIKK